jgi:hypothetical protein
MGREGDERSNDETSSDGATNSYHSDLPRLQTTMQMMLRILLKVLCMSDIHIRVVSLLLLGSLPGDPMIASSHSQAVARLIWTLSPDH